MFSWDAFYVARIKGIFYDYRIECIKRDINMIKSNKIKSNELHWVYKINKLIKVKVICNLIGIKNNESRDYKKFAKFIKFE